MTGADERKQRIDAKLEEAALRSEEAIELAKQKAALSAVPRGAAASC